jgi:hypothetical protein
MLWPLGINTKKVLAQSICSSPLHRYLFLCGYGASSYVSGLGRELYKHLQCMEFFIDMKLYLIRMSSNDLKGTERNVRTFMIIQGEGGGTQWRSWLRHCTTSQKVTGSIPNGVIGIFHWHNPFGRTMTLGLTQPLTEMSTRNNSWWVKEAGV